MTDSSINFLSGVSVVHTFKYLHLTLMKRCKAVSVSRKMIGILIKYIVLTKTVWLNNLFMPSA